MRNILITGGAGFIGINSAIQFLDYKDNVTIFDNLSRKGSEVNLKFLHENYPKITFIKGDVRDFNNIKKVVEGKDIIIHLAGQVAVTTSVLNPREDFECNALGTLNVLEAIRLYNKKAIMINASTNKVYGGMETERVVEEKTRYSYKNLPKGVNEKFPLDFHSPYGCSKGVADQYVRDYSRIYNLSTVVFRQSCIFGPHQFGMEDQGWVAWFVIAILMNKDITIYGNGKQVRDLLYVTDLVNAYEAAVKNINIARGQVYNIGGGIKNSISVWYEFKPILEKYFDRKIHADIKPSRPGDQIIYVSDIRKAKKDLNWTPKVRTSNGIARLISWANDNRVLIEKVVEKY